MLAFIVTLLWSAPLTFAADNNVVGINWSPFHHPDYDSSDTDSVKAVIEEDFAAIKAAGFDLVRTFYSRHGGVQLASYADAAGLKLALGIYMYDTASWTDKQMTAAAQQAYEYPDVVEAIFVGNENVYYDGTGDYTASELIEYIDTMRGYLADYDITDVPVGTVQRYTEWNSGVSDIDDIADACDVLGANIYPFYVDSLTSIEANIDKLQDMVDNVKNNYPNSEIWITETGFPSGGSTCSSEQETSAEKTESYFTETKTWAESNTDTPVFYFQYFDKETSENQDDICNNFFGLCTAEGEAKFEF